MICTFLVKWQLARLDFNLYLCLYLFIICICICLSFCLYFHLSCHFLYFPPGSFGSICGQSANHRGFSRREISSGWWDLMGGGPSTRSHWKMVILLFCNFLIILLLIWCRKSLQSGAADQSDPLPGWKRGSAQTYHDHEWCICNCSGCKLYLSVAVAIICWDFHPHSWTKTMMKKYSYFIVPVGHNIVGETSWSENTFRPKQPISPTFSFYIVPRSP